MGKTRSKAGSGSNGTTSTVVPDSPAIPLSKQQRTQKALMEGDQWEVYVPKGKRKTSPTRICLATINGCAFWAETGKTMTVPVEVARLAHRAGVIQSAPPPGTDVHYRVMGDPQGDPNSLQIQPNSPEM